MVGSVSGCCEMGVDVEPFRRYQKIKMWDEGSVLISELFREKIDQKIVIPFTELRFRFVTVGRRHDEITCR
jgi:hypothetical protein